MATDDTAPDSSTGEEYEETDDQPERTGSQPDTTDGEGDDGEEREPTVPYSRFKQVNDVARWYKENVGSREKIQEFNNWLRSQEQPGGKYTPNQLAQVRQVMREADTEYRELVEEHARLKAERAETEEQLLDDTHDEIVKLAKKSGLPVDDGEYMTVIGQSVMLAIKNDRALYRQWNRGDLSCVAAAFNKLARGMIGPLRGKNGASPADMARIKRQVSSLPTAPSGGAGTVSAAPPKAKGEKGITKDTHDRAWALLQQTTE